MHNIELLFGNIAQIKNTDGKQKILFSTFGLGIAYSQIPLKIEAKNQAI